MNERPSQHRPDTSADTPPPRGGVVRTPAIVGETVDCYPIPTRADTTRTRPDTDTADSGPGVRVEYRASVPRNQFAAALAEALGHLTEAQTTRTYTPDTVRTDDHHVRRAQSGAAIKAAFDIPAELRRAGYPDTERPDTVLTPSDPTNPPTR